MNTQRRLRLSLGGLILLIAAVALGINAVRPRTTRIIEIEVGTGPAVKAGNTVDVNYIGRLRDGKLFDITSQPITFRVGAGQVIQGLDNGLVGMRAGGVRKLIIPSREAYGPRGVPGMIPPDATLDFDVELLKIHRGQQPAQPTDSNQATPSNRRLPDKIGR